MAVFPVPTGRTSDLLAQTRLVAQVQSDQLKILDLQTQVSTGRRFASPSDDPSAAIRGIGLQHLLERKDQLRNNLATGQSYLSATDNAISGVASLLADIRGLTIQATDSTTSDSQRLGAAQQVKQAIQELMNVGNRQFRDRYLFAGSEAGTSPFETQGNAIAYNGNEGQLSSFGDIDLLFGTNVPGSEIFGGLSAEVKGQADLNPIITENTRLRDLYGGAGINQGSIAISDGFTTSIVDLASAETVGDIINFIEASPPTGRELTVRISDNGFIVDMDDAGGGNFTIREVGGGTTAAELGLREPVGVGTAAITGADLNPQIRLTTKLSEILGTPARGRTEDTSPNNDIQLIAKQTGTVANGYTLQYVDDSLLQAADGLVPGAEFATLSNVATPARAAISFSGTGDNLLLTGDIAGTSLNNVAISITSAGGVGDAATATYSAVNNTLEIAVDNTGATTIQSVIDEINNNTPFTVSHDSSDTGDGPLDVAATVSALDIGVVQGNTGNSGGAAKTIFVNIDPGASNANQVIDALQDEFAVAELFDIELESKDTASPATAGTASVDLNATLITSGGTGEPFDAASGLLVTNGGKQYAIDFQNAETVEDVLNILNGSSAGLYAQINETGNGIDIRSRFSGTDFQIAENGGTTATQLGVRSFTERTRLNDLNFGSGVHTAEGTDFTIYRNSGSPLEIDVSSASSIGDVIDLINNHLDNQDPYTAIQARLTETGNGLELVDDNPTGAGNLKIERNILSEAAWDLGLIPRGQPISQPLDGPEPQVASTSVSFPTPNEENTAFTLEAASLGTNYNGVQLRFINSVATGDQAIVAYNSADKILTVDVDPSATTAATVINQINAEGTFVAAADFSAEPTNDSTGLITALGTVATTSGGTSNTASATATALIAPPTPNELNTALRISARQGGTKFNDVLITFDNSLTGDQATAVFEPTLKTLTIHYDATQSTSATIRNAILNEGTFDASLDTTSDPTNNGSGIFGVVNDSVTSGGLPEIHTGTDVNRLESTGVFNTLLRLQKALESNSDAELARISDLIEADIESVSFARADLGARQQGLDDLTFRLEDEDIQLRDTLADEIEVDFVEAISKLTAAQSSLEASLRLTSQTFQLSLLNFL